MKKLSFLFFIFACVTTTPVLADQDDGPPVPEVFPEIIVISTSLANGSFSASDGFVTLENGSATQMISNGAVVPHVSLSPQVKNAIISFAAKYGKNGYHTTTNISWPYYSIYVIPSGLYSMIITGNLSYGWGSADTYFGATVVSTESWQ